MRYSKIFIPTVKDVMQDTEALNYRLLHKAGYIRRSSAGVYVLLPLGNKVLDKIQHLFAKRLEELGYSEMQLPAALNDEGLYKLLFSGRLSYKELPISAWLTREHYSEHIRPRMGLFQPRLWKSMEGFRLVTDTEALKLACDETAEAIRKGMAELQLSAVVVDQLATEYPGEWNTIFFLPYDGGEDYIVSCKSCNSLKTLDSMGCRELNGQQEDCAPAKLEFTPQVKTINEVADYLKVAAKDIVKTLIYHADNKLYGVLVRGDRELSEAKLKLALKCNSLRAATEKEVQEATGAEVGFAGPIGLKADILCDYEVAAAGAMVVGANKTDHHYTNVRMGRDFDAELVADFRCCAEGDLCPQCGKTLELIKGFVIGRTKKQGADYTGGLGLLHVNKEGNAVPALGVKFELHLYRMLSALVEGNNDEYGLVMPEGLAPFRVVVMPVHSDNEKQMQAAELLYHELTKLGVEVLLDDRAERVSIKFKDSELIGIPWRITAGRRVEDGAVEVKQRTAAMKEMHISDIASFIGVHEVEYAEKA